MSDLCFEHAPVGTVLHKKFPSLGPDVFDVFVKTHTGWVLVDQASVHPHARPMGSGYTNITPKVSEV